MRYGRYGWPHFFLRWGLGLTFLWIGVDILRHPSLWIGYVPENLLFSLPRETVLRANGLFDVLVGLALIAQFLPKLAALLATVHLAGIVATSGIGAVLIRDVGLLGAALALLLWPAHYHRKKGWKSKLPFINKKSGDE